MAEAWCACLPAGVEGNDQPEENAEQQQEEDAAPGHRARSTRTPRRIPAAERRSALPFTPPLAVLLTQQRLAAAAAEAAPKPQRLVEIGPAPRSPVPQDPAQEENGATPIRCRIGIRRVNGRYQVDELFPPAAGAPR